MVTTNGTSHTTTEYEGTVERVNEHGIRFAGQSSWTNISKFAGSVVLPAAGQRVRCAIDKSGYIRAIEPIGTSANAEPARAPQAWGGDRASENAEAAPADKDTQIRRMNALGHAVATLSTQGAVNPDAVLALAERYEQWICHP